MRVAVTGVTGIVGGFVAGALRARGDTVLGLSRSDAEGDAGIPPGVRVVRGALPDAGSVDALLGGVDALVHCAFEHLPGRYRGGEGDDPDGFLARNLAATRALLDGADRHGVGRVVLLSSRAVLGAAPRPSPLDDAAAPAPDTVYGELKAAEERLAADRADPASPPVACAVRATGVFGIPVRAGHCKWLDLARSVRDGAPPSAPRRATEVHGEDLADAVLRLIDAPAARIAGRVFNCSDIELDRAELVVGLAGRLGIAVDPPPPGAPVVNAMSCPGLDALGWRPRGRERLASTLDRLVDLLRAEGARPARFPS